MKPEWILVGISAAGLFGSALWTAVNLRIENRLLERIDGLKDWADARFVHKPDPAQISAVSQHLRANS